MADAVIEAKEGVQDKDVDKKEDDEPVNMAQALEEVKGE